MNTYVETTLLKWDDIFKLNKYFLSPFIFRGQQESNWGLQTSIERVLKDYSIHTYKTDYSTEEKWMIHEFIRKFHLYSSQTIKQNDSFEWLAIMQHYGAPTRLLDFTESIFIASYFAAIESKTNSSIWAINRHKLRDNLHEDFKLPYIKREALKDETNSCHIDYANKHICRKYSSEFRYPSTIIPLEPVLFSERLSRQQGLFLMPTNPNLSFSDNLNSAFRKNDIDLESLPFEELINISETDGLKSELEIVKINIPKKLNSDIIKYLQQMNITAEILFPGLDGLAKSLIQTQMR
jgi:hypothetical protein